jgi:hypothetical protein
VAFFNVTALPLLPPPRASLRLALLPSFALGRSSVLEDAHSLYRHQRSPAEHLIEEREQSLNVRVVVNNLNEHRKIR